MLNCSVEFVLIWTRNLLRWTSCLTDTRLLWNKPVFIPPSWCQRGLHIHTSLPQPKESTSVKNKISFKGKSNRNKRVTTMHFHNWSETSRTLKMIIDWEFSSKKDEQKSILLQFCFNSKGNIYTILKSKELCILKNIIADQVSFSLSVSCELLPYFGPSTYSSSVW